MPMFITAAAYNNVTAEIAITVLVGVNIFWAGANGQEAIAYTSFIAADAVSAFAQAFAVRQSRHRGSPGEGREHKGGQ